MFVFLHGDRQVAGRHTLFVAPAAELEGAGFTTPEGKPVTFPIVFEDGRASVPEGLGRYLVARGLAHAARRGAVRARPSSEESGPAARGRLILPRS